jgi:short subunit dehydrogenase-like uncharacterized protein
MGPAHRTGTDRGCGPYARYGTPLVAACADAGTDYCDLTGELHWMKQMIATYQKRAQATGARRFLPKPGEGPSRGKREAGCFELFFHGRHPQQHSGDVRVRVAAELDPGYGATARMLGEAALCLAQDDLPVSGGFCTPASAMDGKLVERLQTREGFTFEVVDAE